MCVFIWCFNLFRSTIDSIFEIRIAWKMIGFSFMSSHRCSIIPYTWPTNIILPIHCVCIQNNSTISFKLTIEHFFFCQFTDISMIYNNSIQLICFKWWFHTWTASFNGFSNKHYNPITINFLVEETSKFHYSAIFLFLNLEKFSAFDVREFSRISIWIRWAHNIWLNVNSHQMNISNAVTWHYQIN